MDINYVPDTAKHFHIQQPYEVDDFYFHFIN